MLWFDRVNETTVPSLAQYPWHVLLGSPLRSAPYYTVTALCKASLYISICTHCTCSFEVSCANVSIANLYILYAVWVIVAINNYVIVTLILDFCGKQMRTRQFMDRQWTENKCHVKWLNKSECEQSFSLTVGPSLA